LFQAGSDWISSAAQMLERCFEFIRWWSALQTDCILRAGPLIPSSFAASGLALTHETAACLFKITIKIPNNHQLKLVVVKKLSSGKMNTLIMAQKDPGEN
jgi:hypothetical protein